MQRHQAAEAPAVQLLSIDGRSTDGWDGDHAAKYLRGRQGSSVMVRFGRRTAQQPGVASRPEVTPRTEYRQVTSPGCSIPAEGVGPVRNVRDVGSRTAPIRALPQLGLCRCDPPRIGAWPRFSSSVY